MKYSEKQLKYIADLKKSRGISDTKFEYLRQRYGDMAVIDHIKNMLSKKQVKLLKKLVLSRGQSKIADLIPDVDPEMIDNSNFDAIVRLVESMPEVGLKRK